jgi:hypothetical protein
VLCITGITPSIFWKLAAKRRRPAMLDGPQTVWNGWNAAVYLRFTLGLSGRGADALGISNARI